MFKWIHFRLSLNVVWVWITETKKPKGRCSIWVFDASVSFSVRTHGASVVGDARLLLIYGTVNPVRMTPHRLLSAETLKKVGNWTLEHPALLSTLQHGKPSLQTRCLVKASRSTHRCARAGKAVDPLHQKWDIRIGIGVRTLAALLLMSPISTAVKVGYVLQIVTVFKGIFSGSKIGKIWFICEPS